MYVMLCDIDVLKLWYTDTTEEAGADDDYIICLPTLPGISNLIQYMIEPYATDTASD